MKVEKIASENKLGPANAVAYIDYEGDLRLKADISEMTEDGIWLSDEGEALPANWLPQENQQLFFPGDTIQITF